MVKIYLFLFCTLLLVKCSVVQGNQTIESNIAEYLDMEITFSQDTIIYGNTLVLTVIFKNKSDSCVSFYPKAKMLIDIYRPTIEFFGYLPTGRFLVDPFVDYSITLNPHDIYKEIFTLVIDEPLFYKGKNNTVVVHYTWINNAKEREYKNCKKLYGRMDSLPLNVFVKEE